jgi:hypothetical protein
MITIRIENVRCRKEGGQVQRLMRDLLTEDSMGISKDRSLIDPHQLGASSRARLSAPIMFMARPA